MPDVVMPRLSDSMEEGTILKWLKAEGDEVARGDELVEIETDKATMTYEADTAGALSIVAQEGETLPIGQVIARIGAGGEAPGGDAAAAETGDGAAVEAPASTAGAGATASAEASGNGAGSESAVPAGAAATAEPPAATAMSAAASPAAASPAPGGPPAPAAPAADGNGGRAKASPVARRIARERGIDLSTLQGTGPGGRIVKADVEAAPTGGAGAPAPAAAAEPAAPAAPAEAAAAPPPPPPAVVAEAGTAKGDVSVQELSRTQQVIARRMAESKATVPEFTITTEVDMEGAVALRSQLKAVSENTDPPTRMVPSYNDMVVKACAIALREFPRANGSYKDGHFDLYSRVNIGVAVAAQDALVVPTVFDADKKSLGEIARDGRALAERVRAGVVTPPELSGGTFTVSNLGMFGVTEFVAVINPPQAAILAVGKMEPRAVVRDGEVVARNTMNITLSCDHRILYGADAAQFLARIKTLLEQPIALAL
jgi:pyruvate dehydrogenase E2 component (dihydrolipoyllysine-residue acetyltransferase)